MADTSPRPHTQELLTCSVANPRPPAAVVAQRKAEIARRYAWNGKRNGKRRTYSHIANFRMRELEKLFQYRYGFVLPDDESGRDDLVIAFHHIVSISERSDIAMRAWASLRAPWMGDAELDDIIQDVLDHPMRWTAGKLAWRLGLTDAERTVLDIRTIRPIDVDEAGLAERQKQRDRERKAAKRRAIGMKPQAMSKTKQEPWKMLGMSRATWYRKGCPKPPTRRRRETNETALSGIDERECLGHSVNSPLATTG